jgi:hypothetical protein
MKLPWTILLIIFACYVLGVGLWMLTGAGLSYGADGTMDFIQYWSAWSLLRSGQNPYDAELMHQAQMSLGQDPNVTIMMWNPPWVPFLISPVLALPFEAAALCWFVINLGLFGLIVAMIPQILGYPPQRPWVYALGAFFLPVIECLKWGQLSLLHSFAAVLFLWGATQRQFFLSGIAAALMTVKPHIYLLLIPPGVLWICQIGFNNARRFVLGLILTVFSALVLVCLIEPHAIGWWFAGLSNPEPGLGVIPVRLWRTATLATELRAALAPMVGYVPDWPLWVLPCLGLLITLKSLFWTFPRREIDWSEIGPGIICISFIFASYGWFYDQSALLFTHFAILLWALEVRALLPLGGLLLIQLIILILGLQPGSAQHHYTWVPIALLVLCNRSKYKCLS